MCRSLYSLCQGAPDRTQMETDHSLHHLRNLSECAPRGQLQTILEHHQTTATGHRGRWLLARGHSPSYQLSGLGKSLPLIG